LHFHFLLFSFLSYLVLSFCFFPSPFSFLLPSLLHLLFSSFLLSRFPSRFEQYHHLFLLHRWMIDHMNTLRNWSIGHDRWVSRMGRTGPFLMMMWSNRSKMIRNVIGWSQRKSAWE
jgi:hypothetical protein